MESSVLQFKGHAFFRERILLATLRIKPIRIGEIRSDLDEPGLKGNRSGNLGANEPEFEASFLRLMEKATNGSSIEINYTGTAVVYRPGVLVGGAVAHDCGTQRSIGYFLEALLALAPFAKLPLNATLTGITSDNHDVSVDTLRTTSLENLKLFGVPDEMEIKITKRGSPPLGGGEVVFRCPNVRSLKPLQLLKEGRIKRIRGIAYCTRVSPQTANRMMEAARSVLNQFIPDIYIYTDVFRGAEAGKSSGFGMVLTAESTTGCRYSAEQLAKPGETAEDVGVSAAKRLLDEIQRGGCVDTFSQWTTLLWMALCPEDVSKVSLGQLSPFTMQFLRDLKQVFGATFKIQEHTETTRVGMACLGVGYINTNKQVT